MNYSGGSHGSESPQVHYLCEAYRLDIAIQIGLHHADLVTGLGRLDRSIDSVEDEYFAWHSTQLSFRAMVLSVIFMEIAGGKYATFIWRLTRQREVATRLRFGRVSNESAFAQA